MTQKHAAQAEPSSSPSLPERPIRKRRRLLVLAGGVFLGGCAGTALRFLFSLVAANFLPYPALGPFGFDLWIVNLAGAFFLGWWVAPRPAGFSRWGRDCLNSGTSAAPAQTPPGVNLRHEFVTIAVGTGLLGSFTTYSSLFVVQPYEPETLVAMGALLGVGMFLALCGWATGARYTLARKRLAGQEEQVENPVSATQEAEAELEEELR